MKDLNDLFALIAIAVSENKKDRRTWFVAFHGHVNKIDIHYWYTGWEGGKNKDHLQEVCEEYLTEDGIQAAYWFVKSRIRAK